MNLLNNLPKEFQSYIKFFKSNRHLLPSERFRIWKCNRRFSQEGKSIDMETICQIIGDFNQAAFRQSSNKEVSYQVVGGWNLRETEDNYTSRVKEQSIKYNIQDHVIIEELGSIYVPEASSDYDTQYKITIKNLVIGVAYQGYSQTMFFDRLDSVLSEVGIHLVFENNYFIPINDTVYAHFFPANRAYLIFKNNKFKSVDMRLDTYNSYKIELVGNIFEDSDVEIISKSIPANSDDAQPNIICLENNIFYKNNNTSSKLTLNREKGTKCYFKGKNTVDNLIISTDGYLYWSGYQNIDPQGKHAPTHKEMFIKLKTKAVQNNDKMQEVILHRELLKCERVLIQKEKTSRSFQDGFILWWSSWISDYGVSWFRPIRLLIYINALLAFIVFHFFDTSYSWWFLFAEFFNPLSSLADMTTMKDSGLISSVNILQKAVLAIFVYEIIKIFRRFSK